MYSIGVVKFWSLKFETEMKKSNFESWFDHIGETQMFKIGRRFFQTAPSMNQKYLKNIQFSEGGQPPLKVIILPNGFYHVISYPENPPETSFEQFF